MQLLVVLQQGLKAGQRKDKQVTSSSGRVVSGMTSGSVDSALVASNLA